MWEIIFCGCGVSVYVDGWMGMWVDGIFITPGLTNPLADWLVYMWFVYVYANTYPLCISFSSLSHMGKREKKGCFVDAGRGFS